MGDMERILLAFSGGIDSCAAVEILRNDGYEVVAMSIDMMGDEAALEEVRENAKRLNIELHIVRGRELFEQKIISNFIEEYMQGRTPAPCTRCNPLIKWRLLAEKADELGIYRIATGHYFRITEISDYHYVTRGRDPQKDQSYYLWGVPQEVLKRAVTPMGERIKADVKARSERKKESMGVCFLRGQHYTDLLISRCGELSNGEIVTPNGLVVGKHNGIARYTIGQRRGEGIPASLRVTKIDATKNEIVVGENSELFSKKLLITDCYFVDTEEVTTSSEITVMVRGIGRNPEGHCRLRVISESIAELTLESPAWAAAPGQPIVLYIGNRVVGGGYLLSAE